jgi:hypothetical protein
VSAADDVHRMLVLVPWLLERPGAHVDEMADVFATTSDQIRRDLALLDFCGLPGLRGGDLFDVTIINDGDADRVGVGDENGAFIDQLRVYGLMGYYFLEVRGARGPIVKTISTTKMLNKLARLYDVPVALGWIPGPVEERKLNPVSLFV